MPRKPNPCAKERPKDKPYEVWKSADGSWTWNVLKKWQLDDDKPYARWFCNVVTPMCPNGEMGDVYVSEIKASARLVWQDPAIAPPKEEDVMRALGKAGFEIPTTDEQL